MTESWSPGRAGTGGLGGGDLGGGDLEVRILPEQGGRLAVLRFRGVDMVVPPGQVPGFWGDTFWPSPQSLFDWPPPAALDSEPYEVLAATDLALALRSQPDPTLGLQVEKRYRVGPDWIGFSFTLSNVGASPRAVAPWQVTRAPRSGLVVWAPGVRFADADRVVKHRDDPGCWYWHERLPGFEGFREERGPGPAGDGSGGRGSEYASIHVPEVTRTSKFFTDARGWAAHVHAGVVMLRTFPDLMPEQMAPRQAELELFFGIERDYIEVENQGAYRTLLPGDSVDYDVEWRMAALPAGIPTDRVTAELLDALDRLRREQSPAGMPV